MEVLYELHHQPPQRVRRRVAVQDARGTLEPLLGDIEPGGDCIVGRLLPVAGAGYAVHGAGAARDGAAVAGRGHHGIRNGPLERPDGSPWILGGGVVRNG
jgi:hypothetical protein